MKELPAWISGKGPRRPGSRHVPGYGRPVSAGGARGILGRGRAARRRPRAELWDGDRDQERAGRGDRGQRPDADERARHICMRGRGRGAILNPSRPARRDCRGRQHPRERAAHGLFPYSAAIYLAHDLAFCGSGGEGSASLALPAAGRGPTGRCRTAIPGFKDLCRPGIGRDHRMCAAGPTGGSSPDTSRFSCSGISPCMTSRSLSRSTRQQMAINGLAKYASELFRRHNPP